MIDDPPGAMFVRGQIDALRVGEAPVQFDDCLVAIDPCVSAGPKANACGIILAGVKDGAGYVLGDARGASRRDRLGLDDPCRSQPGR